VEEVVPVERVPLPTGGILKVNTPGKEAIDEAIVRLKSSHSLPDVIGY
jgi:hypothetical protein